MYTPTFKCPHCGQSREPEMTGEYSQLVMCDCKESQEVWEREHRAEMERRKKARRR